MKIATSIKGIFINITTICLNFKRSKAMVGLVSASGKNDNLKFSQIYAQFLDCFYYAVLYTTMIAAYVYIRLLK